MSQVQIDHGGGDALVTEQGLDRVNARSGFHEMRGEAVT
jgi:hypothetical protein